MFDVVPYLSAHKKSWDNFVASAKNGTFLFMRDYMEYHADRFDDASLMFYNKGALRAVLPANRCGNTIDSHGGLTYGGVVTDDQMKTSAMLSLFDGLANYWRQHGIERVRYKAVPHIYHRLPAEEDLYALFRVGAVLSERKISSALPAGVRPPYSKGRKACVKKGQHGGMTLRECEDVAPLMNLVAQNLAGRHAAQAVHSVSEMALLKRKFPRNIRVFAAFGADTMLAGALLYETARVAHCQYIAANEQGRDGCAPDFLMDALLQRIFADKAWFDWGTSCTDGGHLLQETLILNKESFGGRGVCYDTYEWTL